jgi:hypothetical protein
VDCWNDAAGDTSWRRHGTPVAWASLLLSERDENGNFVGRKDLGNTKYDPFNQFIYYYISSVGLSRFSFTSPIIILPVDKFQYPN